MSEANRKSVLEMAKKRGIDINGKRHISGLGPVTDPASWVSSTADVLAVCKARGLSCSGVVNYQGPEAEPIVNPPRLSDDLVNEEAVKRMQKDPALAEKVKKNPKARKELREAIIDKHGRKVK